MTNWNERPRQSRRERAWDMFAACLWGIVFGAVIAAQLWR